MHHKTHYASVLEAINQLRAQGFVIDFNLDENCLVCGLDKYEIDDLEIVDIYRYEGDSDPSEEAAVYAIESKHGVKGILVTGYGTSTDSKSMEVLSKLKMRT